MSCIARSRDMTAASAFQYAVLTNERWALVRSRNSRVFMNVLGGLGGYPVTFHLSDDGRIVPVTSNAELLYHHLMRVVWSELTRTNPMLLVTSRSAIGCSKPNQGESMGLGMPSREQGATGSSTIVSDSESI